MSSTHGYAAALGLLVVCGLGGCTGGGDDPPAGSSTGATRVTGATGATGGVGSAGSATTTTAGPASTTVQIPAAARAHTAAGAEAFVKFFVEQSNLAWTRPQEGLLAPLSDPGCVACKRLEETASDLVASGERYASDPVTDIVAEAVPGAVGNRQLVRMTAKQRRVSITDDTGAIVRTDPSVAIARTVLLEWGKLQWRVFDAQ